MMYIRISQDELNHFGVKGMRWGVRKQKTSVGQRIRNNLHTEGYRIASRSIQKMDVRKAKKASTSRSEYKQKRREIIAKAKADRGKALVENNQSYKKVLLKSVAKSAAVGAGSYALGKYAAKRLGVPSLGLMSVGFGGAYIANNTLNTKRRLGEIRAYRKSIKKR